MPLWSWPKQVQYGRFTDVPGNLVCSSASGHTYKYQGLFVPFSSVKLTIFSSWLTIKMIDLLSKALSRHSM
jgi:hypothetical protein